MPNNARTQNRTKNKQKSISMWIISDRELYYSRYLWIRRYKFKLNKQNYILDARYQIVVFSAVIDENFSL